MKKALTMAFLVIIMFLLLATLGKMQTKAINECVAEGHSQYYCEKGLM